MPPTPSLALDQSLVSALRAALRSEVGDILHGDKFRQVMRDEVAEAMREIVLPRLEDALPEGSARERVPSVEDPVEEEAAQERLAAGGREEISQSVGMQHAERSYTLPIEDLIQEAGSQRRSSAVSILSFNPEKGFWENLTLMRNRWLRLQEDEQLTDSRVARIADGLWLETFMCIVVLLDVGIMIYVSDRELQQPGDACSWCKTVEWVFQIMYTMEILVKLVAHRQWFFANQKWKANWFDFLLVVVGFAGNPTVTLSGNIARILRTLRLAKALRVLKVMTRVRHLNTFLVCLSGSLQPFFWSLVMLAVIFMMFSLFFAQLTIGFLQQDGVSLSGDLEEMFGSIMLTTLTLYKSVTGGDDWSRAHDAISEVGWAGDLAFLLFVAFVTLALINIITGIFVEAAMQTLAPDSETVAQHRAEQEETFAKDLARLCVLVDHDESGKLTPEQFKDGIKQGRIPTLLALLGLREEHVLTLFNQMSMANVHDEGQVNIHTFVKACMKLKGAATHFDTQQVLEELRRMQQVLKFQQAQLVSRLGRVS